jgi:regulator of protease activity HflC (stomatin/prohibitin superfamily)
VAALIVAVVLVLFVLFVAAKTVRIIPQARAGVVERLGRYSRTLNPGLSIVIPFVDRVKPLIDLREQVVSFPPSGVITQDNVTVGIDTVLYFTITDPKSATYEVANPLLAIEQLTTTTLRNVIGGLTLEETLTSRDKINTQLRTVLDEATGRWGIRVNRVELKAIDPPKSIQEAMEKQMRAERDRRASILNAEGVKQSAILTAEGEKQSSVLRAEGAKTSAILRAEGEASAINTVFRAIHEGEPDQGLLSYQYLQMLPELARGEANKVFVIPSEFSQALGNLGGALGNLAGGGAGARPAGPTPAEAPAPAPAGEAQPTRALNPGPPPAAAGDPLHGAGAAPAGAPAAGVRAAASVPAPTPAAPANGAPPHAGGSVADEPDR